MRARLPTGLFRKVLSGSFALALASCSTEGMINEGTASATLYLSEVDSQLVLVGSPLDPSYQAAYPNPQKVKEMSVRILANGLMDLRCDADAPACDASPFLTNVVFSEGVTRVSVWDIRGTHVADYSFASGGNPGPQEESCTGDDVSGCSETPQPQCTEDDVSGCDEPDPESPSCTGWFCSDSSCEDDDDVSWWCQEPGDEDPGDEDPGDYPDPDPPADCDISEQALESCNQANANLVANGINYQLNCTTYEEDFGSDWEFPMEPGTFSDNNVPCHDIAWPDGTEPNDCTMMPIRQIEANVRTQLAHEGICMASPLVLDLDGDGVNLSSIDQGVHFDLLASGTPMRTAWTDGRDGLLVLDSDGSGAIEDASELFGSYSGNVEHRDGFAALAIHDDNADGTIDSSDSVFAKLRVWQDTNRDGVSQAAELSSLADLSIASLKLSALKKSSDAVDAHGNLIPLLSSFVRNDGSRGQLVDAYFKAHGTSVCTLESADTVLKYQPQW